MEDAETNAHFNYMQLFRRNQTTKDVHRIKYKEGARKNWLEKRIKIVRFSNHKNSLSSSVFFKLCARHSSDPIIVDHRVHYDFSRFWNRKQRYIVAIPSIIASLVLCYFICRYVSTNISYFFVLKCWRQMLATDRSLCCEIFHFNSCNTFNTVKITPQK